MEIRSISASAALKLAAITFAFLIAIRFFWVAHAIFIVAFLGMLLGLAMARAVDYLERAHIRRGIGAPLVLLAIIGVLVGAGFALAPMIRKQTRQLSNELPKAMERIQSWLEERPVAANMLGVDGITDQQPGGSATAQQQPGTATEQPSTATQQPATGTGPQQSGQGQPSGTAGQPQAATGATQTAPATQAQPTPRAGGAPAAQQQQRSGRRAPAGETREDGSERNARGGLAGQLGDELQGVMKYFFPFVESVIGAVAGLIIILFIGMYIAAQPGLYRAGMLHLVPHGMRPRAEETFTQLRDTLRQWLIARVIVMIAVAALTTGGLTLLGIEGAVALGILAGVLEFIPFFGPILAALPAVGIALVDGPQTALWVAGLYLVIQQIEGNLLTPLLLERRLEIPPVLTIVSVAALGAVFGVIGMLIAEPLLAIILVSTKMLYVQDVVGDDVSVGKE